MRVHFRAVIGSVAAALLPFFFASVIREEWGNFGGGPDTVAWMSPSFEVFQHGAFVGGVGIELPNGAADNRIGDAFLDNLFKLELSVSSPDDVIHTNAAKIAGADVGRCL
jgi:hypothetical protein